MSVKCMEIINLMEDYASSSIAESWDNVGLMVGDENKIVEKILVALDIDDNVIDEAIEKKCDMIITHHPFIFKPLKNIKASDITGSRIIKLIQNDICVYSAHTNLDIAKNGTNDTFAKLLKLEKIENLFDSEICKEGLGRIGTLEKELSLKELTEKVKDILGLKNLVICGDLDDKIKKIAICTGSGAEPSFIQKAVSKGCDAYITGDIKYHNAQLAKDLGLNLIDATHYASEVIILPIIKDYLNKCSKRLNLDIKCIISSVDGQVLNII